MTTGLLLDTHIALWWFSADDRLNAADQELIENERCFLSAASIWEIAIKYRIGKLPVSPQDVLNAVNGSAISLLPITPEHAAATSDLPLLHYDPFDRLLIAQSATEALVLLTADRKLADYGGPIRVI